MADENGLDPQFAAAITALIAASGGRLSIRSGYRSVEEQQQLWDDAVKKYGSPEAARMWVAPPGHSNHNRGMAVDLEGDIGLAHELAARFGLVFPMSWEPWHIEPIGARDGHPNAYTTPPPGEQNPATDQSLNGRPDFMAASLASAMAALQDPSVAGAIAATSPQPAGPTTADAATTTGEARAPAAGGGGKGTIDPAALYQQLKAQGLSPAVAAAFVAIAGRESSYSAAAHNDNASTGDDSYGLFQVNLLNGGWAPYLEQHGMTDPASTLRTISGSVEAAKLLYQSSGLHPWGGYKGANWYDGTDLGAAVAASGGEVSMNDLMALQ